MKLWCKSSLGFLYYFNFKLNFEFWILNFEL